MINSPGTIATGTDKNSQELATAIITRSVSGVVPKKPVGAQGIDLEMIQKQYWDYQ